MHDFCVVGHRIRDQLAKRQRLYLARFPAGEHEAGACTTKGAQNFGMHQLSGPSISVCQSHSDTRRIAIDGVH